MLPTLAANLLARTRVRCLRPSPRLRSSQLLPSHKVQAQSSTSAMAPLIRQLFESTSSTYTYLVACPVTKQCLLIDPVLETVDRDVKLLSELQLELVYAINTHCHADHITGTGKLKERLPSAKSGISAASTAKADILYGPNDTITVGDSVALKVLPVPGHTDGCVAYYMEGGEGRPGAVFTGDALLIRGCGRTDFQGGSAEKLYESVHSQLFSLPDDTVVYPAHDYKGQTCSTIGEEKVHNPRLSKSVSEFVDIMNNLNLAYPKKIDVAVPANLVCGVQE